MIGNVVHYQTIQALGWMDQGTFSTTVSLIRLAQMGMLHTIRKKCCYTSHGGYFKGVCKAFVSSCFDRVCTGRRQSHSWKAYQREEIQMKKVLLSVLPCDSIRDRDRVYQSEKRDVTIRCLVMPREMDNIP